MPRTLILFLTIIEMFLQLGYPKRLLELSSQRKNNCRSSLPRIVRVFLGSFEKQKRHSTDFGAAVIDRHSYLNRSSTD